MIDSKNIKIAYFSMEIALDPSIPTYSGGLGVLAGDMLCSAADLGIAMAAVTLIHRKGYFRQHLDKLGNQTAEADVWHPEDVLKRKDSQVLVSIEGRLVAVSAWEFVVRGISGHEVPVYLLDTDLPENSVWDRTLTDSLYGGDEHYRLCQEVVLGIGGVEMLQSLGHRDIQSYHMNEGHSALLTLALLERRLGNPNLGTATDADIDAVRRQCIFTTHTPVPAGQDKFPRALASRVLGAERIAALDVTQCCPEELLNMTYLALRFAHYINGVAMHHGDISRTMFPKYPIRAITNGVHAVTWTSKPFEALYDRHIPEWRQDNSYLRYAVGIPTEEIRETHMRAKEMLLEEVGKSTRIELDKSTMTVGFARRAATYKRADLLFSEPERLRWITHHVGPLQVIYGGKAHPHDEEGIAVIRKIFEAAAALKDSLRVVYIENYDMRWGHLLTSGVDLWLNTPHRPYEASGTSGMKAALNGVPSFSILDGWWIEGCVEGATGWAIGHDEDMEDPTIEIASMYDKLERIVLPLYYRQPAAFAEVMRSAICLNGSFFNTQRMLSQYMSNAYYPEKTTSVAAQMSTLARQEVRKVS